MLHSETMEILGKAHQVTKSPFHIRFPVELTLHIAAAGCETVLALPATQKKATSPSEPSTMRANKMAQ